MPAIVESMAYMGETPWHGLGESVPKTATVAAIEKAAGLGWAVTKEGLFVRQGKQYAAVPDKFAIVRGDTNAVLTLVGKDYVPIQNREVLEFFREYVKAGEAHIETAGSLMDGQIIWALAKMNASFNVSGSKKKENADPVEGYILLVNFHDYGKAARVKFTPIRVVCWNTLMMSLGSVGDELRIPHRAEFDAEAQQDAKEKLGIAREKLDAFRSDAKTLAELKLTEEDAVEIVVKHFNGDPKEDDVAKQPRTVRRIIQLYGGEAKGALLPSAASTGWGLLSAVTQYYDWEKGRLQDVRLRRSWLGSGASKKQKVLEDLLKRAA